MALGELAISLPAGLNRLFAEMWRVPRELLRPGKEKEAAQLVLAQIKKPAALIQDLKAIHLSTEARSSTTIQCLDGRYFECVSMPQLIGGQTAFSPVAWFPCAANR